MNIEKIFKQTYKLALAAQLDDCEICEQLDALRHYLDITEAAMFVYIDKIDPALAGILEEVLKDMNSVSMKFNFK